MVGTKKSRIVDNPIVYTYPRWHVSMDWTTEELYEWLRPHSLVGIALTLDSGYKLMYRVYAKLPPKVETLFILKFNPRPYTKASIYYE